MQSGEKRVDLEGMLFDVERDAGGTKSTMMRPFPHEERFAILGQRIA